MNIKERIKAIWNVLTKKHFVVYASNIISEEDLAILFLLRNAKCLYKLRKLSAERLQMIDSILCDRSVILQSMCKTAPECITPTVIFDCQSEEDFETLKEQEIGE